MVETKGGGRVYETVLQDGGNIIFYAGTVTSPLNQTVLPGFTYDYSTFPDSYELRLEAAKKWHQHFVEHMERNAEKHGGAPETIEGSED